MRDRPERASEREYFKCEKYTLTDYTNNCRGLNWNTIFQRANNLLDPQTHQIS